MRKIMLLVLIAGLMLTACAAKTENHNYALTAIVIDVDRNADTVTVEDFNGNAWTFYGAEDWMAGDCASLVMNDNSTEKIMDDTIESARYSGWTLNR